MAAPFPSAVVEALRAAPGPLDTWALWRALRARGVALPSSYCGLLKRLQRLAEAGTIATASAGASGRARCRATRVTFTLPS